MPYGKIELVEVFLNDIRAQKFFIPFSNGKEDKKILIQGQLRVLPFGFYEIVFPREYRDLVLTTLNFPHPDNIYSDRYKIPELIIKQIRKALHCKIAPTNFNNKEGFPWVKGIDGKHQDVYILPIGLREDKDIEETEGEFKGFKHEAI